MNGPRNDDRRREPARHQEKLAIEYQLVAFLSKLSGSIFWWAEQKKWRLADKIEEEAAR